MKDFSTIPGKWVRLVLAALLLFLVTVPQQVQAADTGTGGLRYSVTVTKFENRANWRGQYELGDAWGAIMTDILNQSGRFIVLGETDMRQAAMNEQDLANTGGSRAPVSGQMTPAQLLVKGVITHVQETGSSGGGIAIGGIAIGGGNSTSEINVTMYMVDSTTGQVLASTSVVGKSSSSGIGLGYYGYGGGGTYSNFTKSNMGKAVENAVDLGTQWMIAQLPKVPWQGQVVLVKDNNIYINRGSREGVSTGMNFVVGTTDIIRDPGTGEVLDESMNAVARLQVDTVKEKVSICEVVSGNAGAITNGMAVQLP
jgi:curli biogenesis system outer membrane secretion channel CsgG